jgi:hypothetical protein
VLVLVVVLALDLLGFCVEKRSNVSAIILFCHCDAETPKHSRLLSWSVKVFGEILLTIFFEVIHSLVGGSRIGYLTGCGWDRVLGSVLFSKVGIGRLPDRLWLGSGLGSVPFS